MAVRFAVLMTMMFAALPAWAAPEAHGEEAKGGLPQFDPTWFASQIFWLVVTFSFLFVIFSKSILPRLSGAIESRESHIQADIAKAEKLSAEAEMIKIAYEKSARLAADEATKAIKAVEAESQGALTAYLNDYRVKSEQAIGETAVRLDQAQEKALQDMNRIAAEVASEAASRIAGLSPDVSEAETVVRSIRQKAKAA